MYVYWNDGSELYHYGIAGQKWGVRRFQNPDGTLTEEGKKRYGRSIEKLEKKTREEYYKQSRKEGKSYTLPSARKSTGKKYDEAAAAFEARVLNDKRYRELSKKAYDAEMKRLLSEKKYINDDDKYLEYLSSKQYSKLWDASEKAYKAKNDRVSELAKQYVSVIKDAKLDDMGVKKHRDVAKKFLDDKFDMFVWDENLEFDNDAYYEPNIEKIKFK